VGQAQEQFRKCDVNPLVPAQRTIGSGRLTDVEGTSVGGGTQHRIVKWWAGKTRELESIIVMGAEKHALKKKKVKGTRPALPGEGAKLMPKARAIHNTLEWGERRKSYVKGADLFGGNEKDDNKKDTFFINRTTDAVNRVATTEVARADSTNNNQTRREERK